MLSIFTLVSVKSVDISVNICGLCMNIHMDCLTRDATAFETLCWKKTNVFQESRSTDHFYDLDHSS